MGFSPTLIVVTVFSVLLVMALLLGLIWFIPIFAQRQKAFVKRRIIQKKTNEEMIRNIRYRSSSTAVGFQKGESKTQDYGSTQPRQPEPPCMDPDRNEGVPSINVTCEEEGLLRDGSTDIFGERNSLQNSLQNSKRRFSSIVFTHSDHDVNVLSDGENLAIGGDTKRERRASMSLFDSCKLSCPDMSAGLSQSTEHLNEIILPNSDETQGKLYFMLAHNEGMLEVVVIKVTNVADRKHREFQLRLELEDSSDESPALYSNETSVRPCPGEVVNFDESFNIDLEEKMSGDPGRGFFLIFSLGFPDSKKPGKFTKIAEIRFDLMELIEGHVFKVQGRDQFVICRNFISLANQIKSKENSGKFLIFLRVTKITPLNLVIGVVELKDLRSTKPFNSVNVRISLATEEKVLETRRSKVIKKKYQTSEGILKVEESFEFNMSLHSKVKKSKYGSETVFLTLFVCGRNNIGFSHVFGKCVIGPIDFADGAGLFHWNKAMSDVGEIIYHWHTLKN